MNKLTNPNVMWTVTTEGDVEGRSTTTIGTFQGSLVELAKQLAGHESYKLCFREIKATALPAFKGANRKEVHIEVDDMKKEEVIRMARLEGLTVDPSNFYNGVVLKWTQSEQEAMEKKAALSKLSDRERKLLNLE